MILRTFCAVSPVLLAVLLAGGQTGQSRGAPSKPLSMAQVWRMDAVYTDREHGVSFRYPSLWQPTLQFAVNPAALTLAEDLKPIAGFGYSEGGFPRQAAIGPYTKTNLEGFDVVYAVVAAKDSAECEARSASVAVKPDATKTVFRERMFSVREIGEGGMSQFTSGNIYATYVGSACYLFETDTAVVMPGVVDGIVPLTKVQTDEIKARLLTIMQSVRIAPSEPTAMK